MVIVMTVAESEKRANGAPENAGHTLFGGAHHIMLQIKEITLMEITDMESSLDRRMRILDEQIAREKAKREEEAVAAGTPAQQVTDGADIPTAPSNFDAIGTWPFPHR